MSEFCSPYIIDADLDLGIDDIGDTGGTDTLDFSSTGGFVAVNVDLSKITTQTIASGLQLTFSTVSIENIYGGGGDDTLFGNRLDNSIIGRSGKDTLFGGAGNDSFCFSDPLTGASILSVRLGKDRIVDFTKGQDKIVLIKSTFTAITSAVDGSIGSNFATIAAELPVKVVRQQRSSTVWIVVICSTTKIVQSLG